MAEIEKTASEKSENKTDTKSPTVPTAKVAKDWTEDPMFTDPDAYLDAHIEEWKKSSPGQTEQQIRNEWEGVRALLGI